jgi:hypothetical protein
MFNRERKSIGVSEILGTMLLLMVAISAVSIVYFHVLSDEGPASTTIVRIVGKGEGGYIYLEHMGGEGLDLENRITYTIGGKTNTTTIGAHIEQDKIPFGVWNLGERLKIPIDYDLYNLDDRSAVITGLDALSNSIVFHGPITLPQPISDVSVNLDVFAVNGSPIKGGDEILVTITITSSGGNIGGAGEVTVHYAIPEGLDYVSSRSPSEHNDNYSPETGYWHAGNVLNIKPAQLVITLKVNETFTRRPTQLALVIDGSGSIIDYDWTKGSYRYKSGLNSARSSGSTQSSYYLHKGKFGCNSLNASGSNSIALDFWYRLENTEYSGNYRDKFNLYLFNGNDYIYYDSLINSPLNQWNHYQTIIYDSQYFIPNFKILFITEFTADDENIYVDDVQISVMKNGNTVTLMNDGFEGTPWDANWRSDWDMTLFGLSNAIKNENVFPNAGSVELTIIQFGDRQSRIELPPTQVISSSVAEDIANVILNINQRKQGTPMSAGIYLATDQLLNSAGFNTEERQAFVIVTDGQPTECSNRPFGVNYPNGPYGASSCSELNARISAENSRSDLLSKFNMTDENNTVDEIDVLAIGAGPDINWLNSSIIWPNPYIWELQNNSFNGPGWVSHIDSFEQFDFAINEMFTALFSISNTVNFVSSTTYDPNPGNHRATVTIG